MVGGTEQNALLVVIRTPKSASTSLAKIVAKAFPRGRQFFLPNTLDLDGQLSSLQRLRHARHALHVNYRHHRLLRTKDVFASIDRTASPGDIVTGGHIDLETCRQNLTRKFKAIALVRDPIDRSLSEYAYARAGFIRKSALEKYDAGRTAQIAGRFSYEGYLDFLLEHRALYGDIACRYLGLAGIENVAAHFAEHIFHFGTVDNLVAFAHTLGRKTGQDIAVEHLNRTSATVRQIPTRAEQSKLKQLYAGDFALHEWCRKHEPAVATQSVRPPTPRVAVPA